MPNSSLSIPQHIKHQKKNSHKTCYQSLQFLPPEIMEDESTLKITRKIRIYPNHEQKIFFNKCFGVTRYIYNKTVDYSNKSYEKSKMKLVNKAINGCIKNVQDYKYSKYQCGDSIESNFLCKKHTNKKITIPISETTNLAKSGCIYMKRKKIIKSEHQCCNTIDESSKYFCKKHKKSKVNYDIDNSFITLRNKIICSNKDISDNKNWLKEIPYDTRQLAVKDFVTALKASISNYKNGNINSFKMNFKSKRKMQSQIFHIDKRAINKDLEIFKTKNLGKLRVRSKMKKWLQKNIKSVDDNCKIIKYNDGRYYLLLSIDKKINNEKAKYETVSLDPGSRTFQTFYSPDGIVGELGKNIVNEKLKPIKKRIEKLQSVRDKTKTEKKKEKNKELRKKLNQKIRNLKTRQALLRTKIKNVLDDFQWKVADFLCKNFNTIILPKFEVQKMVSKQNRINKTVGKDLLSLRHYAFKQKLKHKAKMLNRLLLIVSENLTTKSCGKCGKLTDIGSSKIFKCNNCSYVADRDINASRNILIRTCSNLQKNIN